MQQGHLPPPRSVAEPEPRASDLAHAMLREMIVDLRLPPGAVVNEQQLSTETGFGRMPIREAMAHDRFGPELEAILATLAAEGFEISGEKLKTSPRGYPADHPRIELLRHKQLLVGRRYGFDAEDIGPGLLDRVRDDWRAMRPLVEWTATHAVH